MAWGDSLTYGTGAAGLPYPSRLSALLGGTAVWNLGVAGEDSGEIATRAEAATSRAWCSQIVWAGRNDYPPNRFGVPANVARILAAGSTGRYIILGVISGQGEVTGQAGHTDIVACNVILAATYGVRYLDIRAYLISDGLADAGITPTAQDLTDIAGDTVPVSLRSDSIHLSPSGYTVVAAQVHAKMQALGWA